MKKLALLICCGLAVAGISEVRGQDQDPKHKKGKGDEAQQQQVQPRFNKQNRHLENQQQHTIHQENKLNRHLENQDQHALHEQNKLNRHVENQDQHTLHQENKLNRHLENQQFRAAKHFEFKGNPHVEVVKFRNGNRIIGAEKWQGAKYAAFRNYHAEWHDESWWRHHHSRIVFVFGAPYYWDAGWWYPAWGYNPGATFYFDGPIYGYNNLPPDQVVANVQATLQEQGYYHGEVDGVLGPLTRAAIASYQEENGLYVTSAIDEPTLDALGMS